jgi:hypothetical protein
MNAIYVVCETYGEPGFAGVVGWSRSIDYAKSKARELSRAEHKRIGEIWARSEPHLANQHAFDESNDRYWSHVVLEVPSLEGRETA